MGLEQEQRLSAKALMYMDRPFSVSKNPFYVAHPGGRLGRETPLDGWGEGATTKIFIPTPLKTHFFLPGLGLLGSSKPKTCGLQTSGRYLSEVLPSTQGVPPSIFEECQP